MECKWRGLRVPAYLCAWIDLKKAYTRHYKRTANLRRCVEAAGLKWEGRAHSGLDDARNEARLAVHMMCRGVRPQISGAFPEGAPHRQRETGVVTGAVTTPVTGPVTPGRVTRQSTLPVAEGRQQKQKQQRLTGEDRGLGEMRVRQQSSSRSGVHPSTTPLSPTQHDQKTKTESGLATASAASRQRTESPSGPAPTTGAPSIRAAGGGWCREGGSRPATFSSGREALQAPAGCCIHLYL
jgi:hypothetical protein